MMDKIEIYCIFEAIFYICSYKIHTVFVFKDMNNKNNLKSLLRSENIANNILFLIFIQLQLSAFSPHPFPPPQPIPPPSPTSTLPLDFVLVSFIVAPIDPSPHYPIPTPLWLLLHCS